MAVAETAATLRQAAEQSNAWPFEEARKIVARPKKHPKNEVIFETGYGPSGLPHIGTFGEVARTTMVRHAFRVLTDDKIKTRLIAFSDDMDGLRKVPDNVPNKEMLEQHLGKPLTQVPDPFGTHRSFGEHNNARLRAFLDHFGFDYEFMSSTECYKSGRFDQALLKVLARFDEVMAIMLPSLREERAQSYSPFLPIHPRTGIVMQVPLTGMDARRCLRFNWEQRVGFLAVSDLDGSPYLHLCENRPYELLTTAELDRLIGEIGPLGDSLEKAISAGGDSF